MSPLLRILVVWLIATALNAAETGKATLFEIRVVLDGATADSEQMTLMRQSREGQAVPEVLHVAKGAVLDQSDVRSAQFQADPITGHSQVGITFTERGRIVFAEVTRTNINKRLAVLVDGKVIFAPVIRTEIRDGKAVIDGAFTEKEATELADRITKAVQGNQKGKMKPWRHGLYDQRRDIHK